MRPGLLLLLVFLIVPLIEIGLCIEVGGYIGTIATVSLIVFTAVLGALLVQAQGISTLNRLRRQMDQGRLPALEMFEGVCLLVAGALLLTPGFFTDTLGFLCLVTPLRRAIILKILKSRIQPPGGPPPGPGSAGPADAPRTIEGEFRREDD
jgi:UPF0716 protein FxsA